MLIEKGVITQQEFLAKISEERVTYQRMLNLWGLWLRFSVVLLALSVVALVVGVLRSRVGFGWVLVALGLAVTRPLGTIGSVFRFAWAIVAGQELGEVAAGSVDPGLLDESGGGCW